MKTVVRTGEYHTSRIETLPFINLDPSNPTTIYSALCFAQEQSEKHDLNICPVTFNQPLFQKASEIIDSSNELDRVIVRLGGFHLLMSYLGSIGQIMSGSGLAELWEKVYAKGSVVHMLTGHAYSRAVRAHILSLLALICVLVEKSDSLSTNEREHLACIHDNIVHQDIGPGGLETDEAVLHFQNILSEHLDQAASQSRTGKLWVQYIHQVILMLNFITAERTRFTISE